MTQRDDTDTPDPTKPRDVPDFEESVFSIDGSDFGLDSVMLQVGGLPKLQVELPAPQSRFGDGDRFEILEVLGHGGMGVVYLVRDHTMDRKCVFKFIRPLSSHPLEQQTAAFEKEARLTAKLRHDNIITIYDFGVWREQIPYLVLEYLRGRPLREHLEERGQLDAEEAVAIIRQVAQALQHAHARGVLHRDLKPDNIFVLDSGRVKVLDFGVAIFDPDASSATDSTTDVAALLTDDSVNIAGSPPYMAPEQWLGITDSRTDVWALGVILFEMLTGRRPFESRDFSQLRREIIDAEPAPTLWRHREELPEVLVRLVERALAKDPEDRFESMSALLASLEHFSWTLETSPLHLPYRGAEPFRGEDSPWFFGRKEILHRLQSMLTVRPLIVLVGAPSSGKSSLIDAGLIPLLGPEWQITRMVPGRSPLRNLLRRLDADVTIDALSEAPSLAEEALRARTNEGAQHLFLIDRFEEVFSAPKSEQQTLAAALLSMTEDPEAPQHLLLVLRDDALDQLATLPALALEASTHMLLLPPQLSPDALRAAILRPARRLSHSLDAPLIDALIDDLTDLPAPLSLLQLVALRLWERRPEHSHALTLKDLDALGGVEAIAKAHAEGVIKKFLRSEDVDIARRLLTCLSRSPEGLTRPELYDDQEKESPILEHLIQHRLVTTLEHHNPPHFALAWGSLLDEWVQGLHVTPQERPKTAAKASHGAASSSPRLMLLAMLMTVLAAGLLIWSLGMQSSELPRLGSHTVLPKITRDASGPDLSPASKDIVEAHATPDTTSPVDADVTPSITSPVDATPDIQAASDAADLDVQTSPSSACSEQLERLTSTVCRLSCRATAGKLKKLHAQCPLKRVDREGVYQLLKCCAHKNSYGEVFELRRSFLEEFLKDTGSSRNKKFLARVDAMIDAEIIEELYVTDGLHRNLEPFRSAKSAWSKRVRRSKLPFLVIGHARPSSDGRHKRDPEISLRRAIIVSRALARASGDKTSAGLKKFCVQKNTSKPTDQGQATIHELRGAAGFIDSTCKLQCLDGYRDCDGILETGCEVNLNDDDGNCGSCGQSCAAGQRCCDGACSTLDSDRAHCGACGTACAPGDDCCGGACQNLQSNPTHCGGCGRTCDEKDNCCGGTCVTLSTNPNHCGACDLTCDAGDNCCNSSCFDLSLDEQHCGACNRTCGVGQQCCGGGCIDPKTNRAYCGGCTESCNIDQACCDGLCVNFESDKKHCGSCNKTCRSNQRCVRGVCTQ